MNELSLSQPLVDSHLLAMSDDECHNVMKSMSDNFDIQDEPKVGIFWYDAKNDDLFGITKIIASELQFNDNGLKTVGILHKTWWKKQQMRAKSKNQHDSVFMMDYKKVPRGRIFQKEDGSFSLMCGSWINDHIVELIKDEFDLQNALLNVAIDIHWEVGHGWNEDFE
jgi:hypothetical protein